MAYGSLVPRVKDGIVTALGNRAGLSAVRVSRESPRSEEDIVSPSTGATEAIWVGRDGGQDVEGSAVVPFLTAGQLRFRETFTVWLTVQVLKVDDSQEATSERAWTLAYEVVAAVADDATLGITTGSEVELFQVDGEYEFKENTGRLDRGGYGCAIQIGLSCLGQIAPT